jgi:hypothetical protein
MRPRPLKKAFDLGKRLDVDKVRSETRRNSRSQSLELDYRNLRDGQTIDMSDGKEDDKTFSVTLLVNENEKNVIVDMINRAKNIISRKVEKVIGKKPKSGVSNVETLQTVLESWIGREESREREEKAEEEQLILEQGRQVSDMMRRGLPVPVSFTPSRESVLDPEEIGAAGDLADPPSGCIGFADMEISRISWDRRLPGDDARPFSPQSSAAAPALSAADNVPCPWGLRPDSELYPPRLRRPSSMYGTEAALASSRPPSRLLAPSASPVPLVGGSRPHSRQISVSPLLGSFVTPMMDAASSDSTVVLNEEDEEKAEADASEEITVEESTDKYSLPYCRPASFLVPIGGVWRPDEDAGDDEIVWGQEENKDSNPGGLAVALLRRLIPSSQLVALWCSQLDVPPC